MKSFLTRIRNLPIVSKMILSFVLAGLVPMILTVGVFYYETSKELDSHLQAMSASMNEAMVSELNMVLESYKNASSSIFVDRTVFNIASDSDLSATDLVQREEDLKRVLFRLTVLQPSIETASILSRDNILVTTGQNGIHVSKSILESKEWVRGIESEDESFYIVPLHRNDSYDRYRDDFSITLVRKIMTSGTIYSGALLIDVDLNDVFRSASRIHTDMLEKGLQICITDRNGHLLYDSRLQEDNAIWDEEFLVMAPFTKDYAVAEGTADILGLKVYAAFPRANFAVSRRRYILLSLFFVILAALLTALLTRMHNRAIVKPLLEVSRGMEKAGNGEYVPVENKDYDSEIGALVGGYNRMIVNMQEMIERVYVSQLNEKQAQLAALHTQINPHMLFNTLEAIRMKAILAGSPDVAYMIKILAKMYRTVLDTSNRDHTIAGEIEYAKAFLTLQNILTGEGSYLMISDVPDELLKMSSIPALFEPIVENSIRHGSRGEDTNMTIHIDGRITEDGQSAVFTVTDDGTGMDEEQLELLRTRMSDIRIRPTVIQGDEEMSGKHIGIRNILKRLRLKYGGRADMKILYSDETGTGIEIRLPFEGRKPECGTRESGTAEGVRQESEVTGNG